jgi:hypothetical protein
LPATRRHQNLSCADHPPTGDDRDGGVAQLVAVAGAQHDEAFEVGEPREAIAGDLRD